MLSRPCLGPPDPGGPPRGLNDLALVKLGPHAKFLFCPATRAPSASKNYSQNCRINFFDSAIRTQCRTSAATWWSTSRAWSAVSMYILFTSIRYCIYRKPTSLYLHFFPAHYQGPMLWFLKIFSLKIFAKKLAFWLERKPNYAKN
jgi:hypothetical protein